MDKKQQVSDPGYPQQPPAPPPSSETTRGGAYPQQGCAPQGRYPQQVGYPRQGSYPQQAGYPQQGSYPPGYGYGAAPPMVGGLPPNRAVSPNAEDPGPIPYEGDDRRLPTGFTEKSIRMAFIRKVYSILCLQLAATTGIIALFVFHEGVKAWVRQTPIFLWTCFGIAIVLMIALACCRNVRRHSPTNIIVLALFTLTYAVVIAASACTYKANVVVLAVGITAIVCLALTIFSFQTKLDFTKIGGILFVCMIVLFLFGLVALFLRDRFPILHLVYAGVGTLLFSVYLIHDTQMMIGGRHKYSLSPEEYIFAALNIYTDVIMIFSCILTLFGASGN